MNRTRDYTDTDIDTDTECNVIEGWKIPGKYEIQEYFEILETSGQEMATLYLKENDFRLFC